VYTCIRSIAYHSAAEVHVTMMQAEGLTKLVEHNNKKVAEKQLEGLKTELTEMITQDPPTPVDECLAAIKAKKAEFSLADSELVKVSSYIKTCWFRTAWFNYTLAGQNICWLCVVHLFLAMLLKNRECSDFFVLQAPVVIRELCAALRVYLNTETVCALVNHVETLQPACNQLHYKCSHPWCADCNAQNSACTICFSV